MNEEQVINWLRRKDRFKSLRLVEDNSDRMVFKAEYSTERPYRITVVSGEHGGLSAHFIPWE
jgi:hypothetical protein